MRISPDERKLRKQLEETRKMLESWDGWSPHEAAGRCLRWLGEGEEAAEHFRIAGRKYPVGDPLKVMAFSPRATSTAWPESTTRRAPSLAGAVTCYAQGSITS
jgi:hypothetical protein